MDSKKTLIEEKNASGIFIKYGLHNKAKNEIRILDSEEYPTNIPEEQELFALTCDSLFTASNSQVDLKIQINNSYIEFLRKIRLILYFLIIPGLCFGVARLFEVLNFIDFPASHILSSSNFLNHLLFWTSVLAAQILWYDIFFEYENPYNRLDIKDFTVGELSKIQKTTVEFSAFTQKPLAPFIHNLTADLIAEATHRGVVNIAYLWRQLMSVEILRRAYERIYPTDKRGAFISEKDLGSSLSELNIPVHELVIYTLEETALLGDKFILPEHLFACIWKIVPQLKELLYQHNLTQEDIRSIALWIRNIKRQKDQTKFWLKEVKIRKNGGIFNNWIYGYTFYLNKFSRDLTEEAMEYKTEYGIGHLSEIEEIINVLGKSSRGNIMLVGESGVGKTSLIKGLAQRIVQGNVPESLKAKRIISINIAEMIANAPSHGGLEGIVIKTIEEVTKSGNAILFIDEIHTIMGARDESSGSDISNLLVPFISNPDLKIIGTTTYQDYKTRFEVGGTLATSFDIIEIPEPSTKDTIRIIETLIPKFEGEHKVFITFPAIKNSILLSQKYITEVRLPNKAIGLLEEACVRRKNAARADHSSVVTSRDVQEVISIKTSIPVTSIGEKEAKELLELEDKMHAKVIGQDDAVKAITEALKRSRSGVRRGDKPIATFLFMGPTGVGKTHVSKTLAELYFGGIDHMVRLDMSEYQDAGAINRIIGSSSAPQSRSITLIDHIRRNPHTLILLDELEKAHPELINIFLQLFDEGRLTDTMGQTVDFTNTIIIATSNVGTANLQNAMREKVLFQDAAKQALSELRQHFKPEFINRFDKIIVFHPLEESHLIEIVKLQLNTLAKRLEEKGIHMTFTDQAPIEVAKAGYSPEYGAREINRVIQNEIEQKIADKILQGEIGRGDRVEVTAEWINPNLKTEQQAQQSK